MSHAAIIDYNKALITQDTRCDIIEYIRHINSMHEHPLDLSFMEELLSFIEQDTCCIPHTLLIKYGVFSEINASAHVKKCLFDFEFIEGKDFLLPNVREQKGRGGSNKIMYHIHPNAFKLIVLRSKCDKKYAKYYLLLEKSVKYYHDYQLMYKEYIINQKDEKIDQLRDEIKKQSEKIENQSERIERLLDNTIEIKENLEDLTDFAVEQYEQKELEELKVTKILPDRINEPLCNEYLILFKYINSYYVIKGIRSYVIQKFRKFTGISYRNKEKVASTTDYKFLKEYCNVPNSRHLYRALQRYKSIKDINGNYFKSDKSDEEIIDIIQEVFDLRLTVAINDEEIKQANNKAVKEVNSIKKNRNKK
jgi:hypothetical protein